MILLASGGAGVDLLSIWGHWQSGNLPVNAAHDKLHAQVNEHVWLCRYIGAGLPREESSPCGSAGLCNSRRLGADQFHETTLPWQRTGEHSNGLLLLLKGTDLCLTCSKQHCDEYMARSFKVSVPEVWIDALFPEVRGILEQVQARNARMQSGKRQLDDRLSDRAAEGFLKVVIYS